MENNPWNLEDDYSQQAPSNYNFTDQINDRESALIRKYPILCSIPNAELFTSAMQGGNASVNIRKLSDKIMSLASAHMLDLIKSYTQFQDYKTRLQDKINSAVTPSPKLQQQNTILQQQVQILEQEVATNSQFQQQNNSLQQKIQNLEQQAAAARNGASPGSYRTAEHPDLDIFSADNHELREELPLFIRKINMKFIANGDWYPSEQSKMIYLVSHLKGKVYSTISHGINRNGTVNFSSADAILVLLEQTFADVDECNSARRQIPTMKQGQKDTSTQISDWFDIAQKTQLSDDTLIIHLYDSLHPTIVSHLQNRIMLRQELPTDLTPYLVEVRHINHVLGSSNPGYTKNKVIPPGNDHPFISRTL
ncbi:hypothetical protein K3495_g8522 [Podosphaera aphanis]|nr:hypothetical protein K3495_g8522 [Podosphaera aphanis]